MDFEPQLKLGLQNMWYPICQSAGVKEKPRGFHRLGQDVVVWRDSVGKIHIHEDRCLHRGAKLSVGEVVNGSLRCAYHGWCYDTSGQCVTIPTSKTAQTKLAPRFCRQMPVSPATTPEPKLMDSNKLWIKETTLRSRSTQATYTVLPNAAGFPGT